MNGVKKEPSPLKIAISFLSRVDCACLVIIRVYTDSKVLTGRVNKPAEERGEKASRRRN